MPSVAVSIALAALTLFSLGSAFRDNDQAMFLFGGLQLSHGRYATTATPIYNFDKQWGTYFSLDFLFRAFPHADPVLGGNALQVALLLPALLACIFVLNRYSRTPLWLFLPIVFSPALVLYMPFLASASMSLAFLLFALAALRGGRRLILATVCVAAAAACRGDAVLVIPVMICSTVPRCSLWNLLKSRTAWLLSSAALLPVLLGKLIDTRYESDLAGFAFYPFAFGGFLVFALGIGALFVLGAIFVSRITMLMRTRAATAFYALELFAFIIPIAFYWSQLYSPRYLFLTLVSILCVVSSKRTILSLQATPAILSRSMIAIAILPWFVGLRVPDLHRIRPTLTDATVFPTADGAFPMGAFAAFTYQLVARDHFDLDHNQKTWDSAKTVNYETCPGGIVPIVNSPMRNYLMLAAELQGKHPLFIRAVADSPCGLAYVDSRSIARGNLPPDFLSGAGLKFVSQRAELGRPILIAQTNRASSEGAEELLKLPTVLHGIDAEVFPGLSLRYRTVFPPYMKK